MNFGSLENKRNIVDLVNGVCMEVEHIEKSEDKEGKEIPERFYLIFMVKVTNFGQEKTEMVKVKVNNFDKKNYKLEDQKGYVFNGTINFMVDNKRKATYYSIEKMEDLEVSEDKVLG